VGRKVRPPSLALCWTSVDAPAAARFDAVVRAIETGAADAGHQLIRVNVSVDDGEGHDGGGWSESLHTGRLERLARPDTYAMVGTWDLEVRDDDGNRSQMLSAQAEGSPTEPWQWAPAIDGDPLATHRLDAAAEAYASVLRLIALWTDVVWAAFLYDSWGRIHPLPYERFHSIRLHDATHNARGYYWMNLLTAGHLAKLGGAATVAERANALDFDVEAVPGRDALIVRAAPTMSGFDDRRLAAIHDLIKSALDPQPYKFYDGPPLRVIREPGTAFRRMPPEIEFPWFTDSGLPEYLRGVQLIPDDQLALLQSPATAVATSRALTFTSRMGSATSIDSRSDTMGR